MKPLLAILSYAKANAMVERHWPWFEKSGADILFVGRENTVCICPEPDRCLNVIKIGQDSYVSGDNLPRLFIETLKHCLAHYDHDWYVLAEPDTIFIRPIPDVRIGGLWSVLAGGNNAGFFGRFYFHPVWMVDKHTAAQMVDWGERMLDCGLIELGFPDRFIGLMVNLYDIPYHPFPEYSRQSIDNPGKVREAREAIIEGAVAIHGVKTLDQLNAITSGLVKP